MAVIKVTDIAYVRLRSPDLDLQAEFLDNFGLVPSSKSAKALYYRGTDPVHHLHITEKGDPKFVAVAYHAASEDDLKTLAKVPGASGIEELGAVDPSLFLRAMRLVKVERVVANVVDIAS